MMTAMALLLFPKLALGLSGFETGVAVMPLVRGDTTDTDEAPVGRFRNTKKLLGTAALIMNVLKFLAFGEGDTAPVTREVLRKSEPDPLRRPRVHVG